MLSDAKLAENDNTQNTHLLSSVFDDTSTSYKLFWFRALLEILKQRWNLQRCGPIAVSDILVEMLTAAWHPVCLFRLSLGTTDKLQTACEELQTLSGLVPADTTLKVRTFIASNPDALENLWHLVTYVPALFLTPWFATEMRGISPGTARVKRATELALERQGQLEAPLYSFAGRGKKGSIQFDRKWEHFLRANIGLLEAFADHHLCAYLQARNPSTPGVIRKLRLPQTRRLTLARSFWVHVQNTLKQEGKSELFIDIYSGERLESRFAIDHFLPWSFVAHDQLWNLTPVSADTNSKKSDSLPDVGHYLPFLAILHWHALNVIRKLAHFHDDYISSFREDVDTLIKGGDRLLCRRYNALVIPQIQLATNQGFKPRWRFPHEQAYE